ncbi:hypothetical protein G6F55_007059 [Rhizopus delemar]|uniref:Ubiquitin-like protease family profile domain-containing protein n=3 Tax=Rhizopus TaxID=4842 RepID=I1BN67_RHIO9|nr:hypothetical protein RO3G_02351 [Rhizopus delemar RA 99-880]KAG1173327.1 hypothetical protein G6F36_011404 [Rhizopus arrhizus]KAG1455458.1 hypothetical protein G6F55_007059 [Rhizopus delemar]KAG1494760.1 hypothetical protein G6F54_007648 [Rhizopus delemar]KAG1508900.1 hypothetical protein G6F53_007849 [Rhizopus delemar]|eukprot:EIE77647.1 hypothetical protein RO3G_02351 [Rhizopus delemar RA 99-880]
MRQNSANLSNTPISLEPTLSRKRSFDDLDDSNKNNDASGALDEPKASSIQSIMIDLTTDSGEDEDVGESTASLPKHHIKRRRRKQEQQDNAVIMIEKLNDKGPLSVERTCSKDQEIYEISDDSSDEEKCGRKRKSDELSDNLLEEEISYKEKCHRQRKAAKISDNLLDEEVSFEENRSNQMALNKEKCGRKRKADELFNEKISFEKKKANQISSKGTETKEEAEDYLLNKKDTKLFGEDKHILMYPFNASKQHSVYWEDIERLKKGRFLNDTIINICSKIWQDEYPNNGIYVYTSFFFTKLKECKAPEELSSLSRWTRGVNLFEKDLLIIPVAEHKHWFLVLVANPGACIGSPTVTGSRFDNGKIDKQKPYIMVIDSLGGTQHHVRDLVTKYLKSEAKKKNKIEESSFIAPQFVQVESPIQDNHYDCGLDNEQSEAPKEFRVTLYKYMACKVKEYAKFKFS